MGEYHGTSYGIGGKTEPIFVKQCFWSAQRPTGLQEHINGFKRPPKVRLCSLEPHASKRASEAFRLTPLRKDDRSSRCQGPRGKLPFMARHCCRLLGYRHEAGSMCGASVADARVCQQSAAVVLIHSDPEVGETAAVCCPRAACGWHAPDRLCGPHRSTWHAGVPVSRSGFRGQHWPHVASESHNNTASECFFMLYFCIYSRIPHQYDITQATTSDLHIATLKPSPSPLPLESLSIPDLSYFFLNLNRPPTMFATSISSQRMFAGAQTRARTISARCEPVKSESAPPAEEAPVAPVSSLASAGISPDAPAEAVATPVLGRTQGESRCSAARVVMAIAWMAPPHAARRLDT